MDVLKRGNENADVLDDSRRTDQPLFALFDVAEGHALGFHGRRDPALGNLDRSLAHVHEKLDALFDVERYPFVPVVLEDGQRFVEPPLGGGRDSMLGFGDSGGAMLLGDGLSQEASFRTQIPSPCWGFGPRISRVA